MISKGEAIITLYPSVINVTENKAYDAQGNEVAYSKQAVEDYLASIAYKEQRAKAYPAITDQLDTIFHDGLEAWKEQIQAVKDKYPKA